MKGIRLAVLTATALLLWSGALFAEVRGMVTRLQGEDISVNLGVDKVKPGTLLYVYDSSGNAVATVKVVETDDMSSRVQIVSLEPRAVLSVGCWVTDRPYAAAVPPAPAGAPLTPVAAPSYSPPPAHTPPPPAAQPMRPTSEGREVLKAFQACIKRHTQVYTFSGSYGGFMGMPDGGGLQTMETVSMLSPFLYGGYGGASVNPFILSTTLLSGYEMYQMNHSMRRQFPQSAVQVIFWDKELANAYADYYLYKEAYADSARRDEVRRSLLAQKGVDSSFVFQVLVRNRAPIGLQLSPFDWHLYMLDELGERVKAERYDESLDRVINPNQEAQGFVYFPRTDPAGHATAFDEVTVQLEDIQGNQSKMHWKVRGGP